MKKKQKQKTPDVIEAQLYEDENLVWWGQPVPSMLARKVSLPQLLMSIFIIGFALFFINVTQAMFADRPTFSLMSRSPDAFDTFLPIFFLIIPSIMILGGLRTLLDPAIKWYEATKTYYALTNKRAIIIKGIRAVKTQSFYDEQMKQLNVTLYHNGIGDVIFATNQMTRTYQHGSHGGFNVNFSDEGTKFSTGRQQRSVTYNVAQGFKAVPDARIVEDFIAQMFFDDDDK